MNREHLEKILDAFLKSGQLTLEDVYSLGKIAEERISNQQVTSLVDALLRHKKRI